MSAKFKHTHSHRAFAEDVALAITVAGSEQPPDVVQEVRGCLIYATLGTLAIYAPTELLSALARVGELERTLGLTSLIPGERERSLAYVDVAEGLLASNELEEAKYVLERALKTAEAHWSKGEVFGSVALTGRYRWST
jgi:hypothetical protein